MISSEKKVGLRKPGETVSLYDNILSKKSYTSVDAKKMIISKVNIKSKDKASADPVNLHSKPAGYNPNGPLSKYRDIKEVLTSRKTSHKTSLMESKKSPRSEMPLHLISSLKSDDQFRIYDRSNIESDKILSEDRSFGRVFARAQTNGLNSPQNNTSANERDLFSLQDMNQPMQDYDQLFRRSIGPALSFPEISNPELSKAMERIQSHVEERDSELQLLREENSLLREELASLFRENQVLKSKLSLHSFPSSSNNIK